MDNTPNNLNIPATPNIPKIDKLQQELVKYKHLVQCQKERLEKQQQFIDKLQRNIKIMEPFVELTKTIKQDNSKMWEHYALKTVENKKA